MQVMACWGQVDEIFVSLVGLHVKLLTHLSPFVHLEKSWIVAFLNDQTED